MANFTLKRRQSLSFDAGMWRIKKGNDRVAALPLGEEGDGLWLSRQSWP